MRKGNLHPQIAARKASCEPIVRNSYVDAQARYKNDRYFSRGLILISGHGHLTVTPLYLKTDDCPSIKWTTPLAGEPIWTALLIKNVEDAGEALFDWVIEILNRQSINSR